MYLEIDMGNTRTKWRIRDGLNIVKAGLFFADESLDQLESMISPYIGRLTAVWIVSVVSEKQEAKIICWVQDRLSLKPLFAKSSSSICGVTNAYKKPELLGVDRWLGILSAYHRVGGACIVFSFGTAVTADAIGADGGHLGGFIGPGLSLLVGSLSNNTSRIQSNHADLYLSADLGLSTSEAICGGCTSMLCGFVDNAIEQMRLKIGDESFELIFTGGDAIRLLPFYSSASLINDLVLDGLKYVMGEC